jgi:hypothetical protein
MTAFAGDQSQYPGLPVAEQLVWREFLRRFGALYDRFDYNVRLGPGVTPPDHIIEPWRSASIAASKPRSDVIGWQGSVPTIFEIERYAKADAIGQVLHYLTVWEEANPAGSQPVLALVCADHSPTIEPTLEAHGITLYQVPVDFTLLAPPRLRS